MEPLTRTETLQILKCLGVDLPVTTKISEENLDRRLRNALDAAQYKDHLPSPFKLTRLPSWPTKKGDKADTSARSLFEAVRRGSIQESRQIHAAKMAGGSDVPTLYVDPFTDLRQTLMGLGKFLDDGVRWCVLQDREKKHCAINLRVRRCPFRVLNIG